MNAKDKVDSRISCPMSRYLDARTFEIPFCHACDVTDRHIFNSPSFSAQWVSHIGTGGMDNTMLFCVESMIMRKLRSFFGLAWTKASGTALRESRETDQLAAVTCSRSHAARSSSVRLPSASFRMVIYLSAGVAIN